MSTPERWSGITRRRRTIRTTGLGRRRRCWSTATSAAAAREDGADRQPQRLLFTLDRRTGEHMITSTFSDTVNWAKG